MISDENYNSEHYEDFTAGSAIENATADIMAKDVIRECLRYLKGHGFRLMKRMELLHEKTGRIYK